jgi:NADH-quinone oxidoreductase subunit L
LFGGFFNDSITVLAERHPAMEELAREFHGPIAMAVHAFTGPVFWLALAGVVLSWFFYLRRPDIPAAIQRRFSFLYRLLDNKYYLDWFNENVLTRGARLLGTGLWRGGDVGIIDNILIDGTAKTLGGVAILSRRLQSGYLYWYALVMIIGVIGLMTWHLWPFLANLLAR